MIEHVYLLYSTKLMDKPDMVFRRYVDAKVACDALNAGKDEGDIFCAHVEPMPLIGGEVDDFED